MWLLKKPVRVENSFVAHCLSILFAKDKRDVIPSHVMLVITMCAMMHITRKVAVATKFLRLDENSNKKLE